MISIKSSFTILFENPYWIGIFEFEDENGYSVAKFIFGKEPTAPEVYEFILRNLAMIKYSSSIIVKDLSYKNKVNPKRKQREAAKLTKEIGISSKAHEALKLEFEKNKKEKMQTSKEKREELEKRKFMLKQEKKKQKQKGH